MKRRLLWLGPLLLMFFGCQESREQAAAARPSASSVSSASAGATCEHRVPATLCPKCNPQLAAVFKAKGDWCPEHGFPESFCPTCHPDAKAPDLGEAAPPTGDPEIGAIEARVVRLRDPAHEAVAGFRTVAAKATTSAMSVECSGQLAYNQDKLADVRAVVSGVVRRVRVELGASVKQGAALFDVQSSEVGQAQGALISARGRVRTAKANLKRQQQLAGQGVTSARDVEVAEQEVSAAKADQRTAEVTLRMTGASGSGASGRYTLKAPLSGTVVARSGVVGLLATDETPLATIADVSSMWVLCEVPESDAHYVSVGQVIRVSVGEGQAEVEGAVSWIASEVDPRTRLVTARAVVPNPEHKLRANQFVTAKIDIQQPRTAVTVPRSAVQRVGEREVVFVRTAEATYAPRVVVRRSQGESLQVEGRVSPGDLVVTDGAILLRTEILPGSIGAGCCEVPVAGGD